MEPLPPINKVYCLVVQEENNKKSVKILMKKIIPCWSMQLKYLITKANHNTSRILIDNVRGHTVDFCYQKHDHPNFNKSKPPVNALTIQSCDHVQPIGAIAETSSTNNTPNVSQAKYDQLIDFLQQVNLLP